LRLRQFEQQVGVLGVGGEVLLRGCDCALFVGQRIELRAKFRSDFESGLSGRGSSKRKHCGQETERTHGGHSCEDYSGLDRRFRSHRANAIEADEGPETGSELTDKIAHPDAQRIGDDLKRIERHALASILQPVKMNAIQAGEFGKLILRDSFLQAQSPDSFANCPVDVLQQLRLRV
jgi:hypothetical protein